MIFFFCYAWALLIVCATVFVLSYFDIKKGRN